MSEIAELKQEQKGDILVMAIKGRLDAVTTPAAEQHVSDVIGLGNHKLLFKFDQVDYLSSAGMRMLLTTAKKLKLLSGKLVVCSIGTNVMDVLQMSGFDHVLDIATNEEEALTRF